jgi:hypothetical protein
MAEVQPEPIEIDPLVLVSMTRSFLNALSANDLSMAQPSVGFAVSSPCSLAGSPADRENELRFPHHRY